MTFKIGDKKPANSGRQIGTPNRKTSELIQLCDEKGINPFAALLELAKHEQPELRLSALKEICQYLYPKRKALEHSGDINNPFADKSYDELKAMVKTKMNE
jgi:hypothetical protein